MSFDMDALLDDSRSGAPTPGRDFIYIKKPALLWHNMCSNNQ